MENAEMKNLPEWFVEHPVTKTIFAKHEDDTRAKRKLAREILDRIKHEQEQTMPKLYEAISRAEEALAEAKKNVTEKEKALTWAAHKRMAASIDATQAIQAQESILWETAPPVINEIIKHFQDRLDDLRRDGITGQEFPGKVNLFTQKREPYSTSNIEAICLDKNSGFCFKRNGSKQLCWSCSIPSDLYMEKRYLWRDISCSFFR